MKRIRIILFSAFLMFTTGALFAQNRCTITGVMADSLSKEKIFYATIGLQTADSTARMVGSTFTDANGKFTLADVPAGDYNLKAMLVGYDLLVLPVTVSAAQKTLDLGTVLMKKISATLQEVKIKGERPVYLIDGEKTMYNVADDPTVQSGTAADALQNAPGVEVDAEGNITLRGVSSVEIWLNNKPSNMNEEALKQFIKQMPAGTIEKIEVITNPSARYSAKGSGGIINIVTSSNIKKNSFLSFGLKGSSMPDVNPFVSYVYANQKFSFSSYLNYSYRTNKNSSISESVTYNDTRDTSSMFSSWTNFKQPQHNPGLFLNASFTPDTANTIYMWGGAYLMTSSILSTDSTRRYEYIYNPGDYSYLDITQNKGLMGGGYAGTWFEHRFNNKGHKISANANWWTWNSKSVALSNRDYFVFNTLDKERQDSAKGSNHSVELSLDYTIPYHKNGEIELGVSADYGHVLSDAIVDTMVVGTGLLDRDYLRSCRKRDNDWGFDAYATIEHRFGNFTLKGGLRSEYQLFDMKFLDHEAYNLQKHYWGLYPSIHLSYRTKSMHNFKLSYTRRVNNPSASELTPYRSYGEDSFSMGNPELRQAFTNSVEAGWTKFIPKFGNVGVNAYFKNTKDNYNYVTDVMFDPVFNRLVVFSQPINAGKSLNTGAELNVMYRLKAFMNIRFYANMYYMQSSFQFRDQEAPHTVQNLGYSFRLNFWAKAWKVLEINMSANYASKSKTLFTIDKPHYSIDAGLRAEVWKHRISLFVNVNDIFNWNKMSSDNTNPFVTSSSVSYNSWFGRTIRGGIEFKFGKMELESAQARSQGVGQMGQ